MPYSLFALTNDPANRIVRFALSSQITSDVTAHFTSIEQSFDRDIQERITFDGKYKPSEGEALVIQDYDDIDNLEGAISNPLGQNEINPTPDAFDGIKALFTGYITTNGETKLLIQYFDRRKIISTNGLSIFHNSNVYDKIEGIGLTIDNRLSATLHNGILTFFSFHLLRQIFDLSEYYREATDADIIEFLTLDNIYTDNQDEVIATSDTWIRRKVALIQQSRILETVPINEIKAVAFEFNIPLVTKLVNNIEAIVLPKKKADLKTILRFLDEDYYKSPLSKTRCITNSKRIA